MAYKVSFRSSFAIITILLFHQFIFAFGIYAQEKNFTIKGKIVSCSEYKTYPFGYIYLLKDAVVIDSVDTYRSFLDLGWISGKFKFKGLKDGEYEIRYETFFDEQDYPQILISDKSIKGVNFCYDKLPERLYKKKTILDNLQDNDTLFINVYIAAGGEFGGYDEGFWITKKNDKYIGRFYKLPNTYGSQRDVNPISMTYSVQKTEIKPITGNFLLCEQIITEINRFLTEIEHYQDNNWVSNAPEHFLIYDKNRQIFKVKNYSNYKPYLKLRNKIKTLPTTCGLAQAGAV